MKDYEQLYYDALFELKQKNNEIDQLKEQIKIMSILQKSKTKQEIAKSLSKYLIMKEVDNCER